MVALRLLARALLLYHMIAAVQERYRHIDLVGRSERAAAIYDVAGDRR